MCDTGPRCTLAPTGALDDFAADEYVYGWRRPRPALYADAAYAGHDVERPWDMAGVAQKCGLVGEALGELLHLVEIELISAVLLPMHGASHRQRQRPEILWCLEDDLALSVCAEISRRRPVVDLRPLP